MALVERDHPELPLKTQAELLGLSRSGLYYQPKPISAKEVALKHAIDEIHTRYPFYGSRRITAELRQNRQKIVARETVHLTCSCFHLPCRTPRGIYLSL